MNTTCPFLRVEGGFYSYRCLLKTWFSQLKSLVLQLQITLYLEPVIEILRELGYLHLPPTWFE